MLVCCKIADDETVLQQAILLCSEQRKMRVSGIKSPNKKAQSITAGLLLRYCLLKNGYDDNNIKISDNGKPYIEGNPIYFSLSHSGEYAGCITADKPVGIDIQKIVDIKERTTERFCTEKEIEYLKTSKTPQVDAVKLWTLKESYLKASGCSTAKAFAAEFDISTPNIISGPVGYKFDLHCGINGYVIATCLCSTEI